MKTQQTTTQAPKSITGVMDIMNIVDELWERAADSLTKEELEWFADAGNVVFRMKTMEKVINGIGCLVSSSSDDLKESFGDCDTLSSLLFFLSESVRNVCSVVEVSQFANYRLRNSQSGERS